MCEENNIELRSEEFQEILGSVPHWILRWGITVLAIAIVILLSGSAVIKYPDVLSSQVLLTGSIPPAVIVSRTSGKLKELYVTDNQNVKTRDYLAVIENPANTKDIIQLKEFLSEFQVSGFEFRVSDPKSSPYTFLPLPVLHLGALQQSFSAFQTVLQEYSEYNRLMYYQKKIDITKERVIQYEKQYAILLNQQKLTEEQLALAKNKFQRDSLLSVKGMIAKEEFENSRNVYLSSLMSYENIKSSLNNMQIQIGQFGESLLDIEQRDIETINNLRTRLQTQISQLEAEILNWELNYVLQTPIDGKITFTNFWVENQNVAAGSAVFTIVPVGKQMMMGKAMLPIARSGKVKIGQKVNIRLQNFPENEYGILKGTVQNISLAPVQIEEMNYYTVEISLDNGLITTYNKELPNLPDMQGQADIVTEDLSLLERLVLPLKKILRESI